MTTVTIEQAQRNLPRLIEDVAQGERVVITRNHGPVAELAPVIQLNSKPTFGSAKSMVKITEDFDAPIEDFQDYKE